MTRRSYEQFCPLAKALDIVGERWTLLMIRELLLAPRRYTDLQEALPKLGSNLLSDRLKRLEEEGVIRRRRLEDGPAVYELTERGEALRPAVLALGRWGTELLSAPGGDELFRPGWLALAFEAIYDMDAARGVRETYEIRVADEVVHVMVDDGRLETHRGPAESPDLVLEAAPADFIALGLGELGAAEAVESGRARIEGDLETLERSIAILAPGAPAASPS